jgi:D-galactarolactone cycloisomerase
MPHIWGSGIALSAGLHSVASIETFPLAAIPKQVWNEPMMEFDRNPNPLRDELVNESFEQQDGFLGIRKEPGLGITVNRDALEKYSKT